MPTLSRLACLALLLAPGQPPALRAGPVERPGGGKVEHVDFERHVQALLGKLGCSAGSCHGSFQGKGGFQLSLFGHSPEKDHRALTREAMGRRVNFAQPDQSLLLLKAAGLVPHGGGKRLDAGSWQYRLLQEWVAGGADWKPGSGAVLRMEVSPTELLFDKPGEAGRFAVRVEFADGTAEDVTALSQFQVNDDYVAQLAGPDGVRGVRPGDTAVVLTYRGHVAAARALVKVPVKESFIYPTFPEVNVIDREVMAKLRKLNIAPSDLSGDGEFLRRVTLDTIGSLPSPEEARRFLADDDPRKRTKKIDELLRHRLHAALWATRFSDITGNSVDAMDPTWPRPQVSKAWHDWFRKRLADNVPYDEIVKGVLTSTSRDGLSGEAWAERARKIEQQLKAGWETDYAQRDSLDLFWKRKRVSVPEMGEHTAAAFLGIRLECAQCHKHPYDRWTQNDYLAYAMNFSGVKVSTSRETKLSEVVGGAAAPPPKYPVRNQPPPARAPRALGGPEFPLQGDPRVPLFEWMRSPDNPYFARSFVNRVWAHYFGRGLVHPVDNFSVANPPANEKLLDALARRFVESKFDIRELERTVLLSRIYQLGGRPNDTNRHDRTNFSRSYPRRLMAEQVIDVLNDALGVKEDFGTEVPPGSRAIEIAPSKLRNFNLTVVLNLFGRPPRRASCDCERPTEPSLAQTLYLMTDPALLRKVADGRLKGLLASRKTDAEIVEELVLATLTRLPTNHERDRLLKHVREASHREAGYVDVVWALLNMREFILNH